MIGAASLIFNLQWTEDSRPPLPVYEAFRLPTYIDTVPISPLVYLLRLTRPSTRRAAAIHLVGEALTFAESRFDLGSSEAATVNSNARPPAILLGPWFGRRIEVPGNSSLSLSPSREHFAQ
jgi:hypothetical protein